MDIKFKVQSVFANLSEYQDTKKKICLVSWNDRPAKIDIRNWRQGEGGQWLPGKGITLSDEEARKVAEAINLYLMAKDNPPGKEGDTNV